MLTLLFVFACIMLIWYLAVSFDYSIFSKMKKIVFKHGLKTGGEQLTLMAKKCDCCGTKTIYLDGDDTSNLKVFVAIDPDTGEEIKKLCCDECYIKLKNALKQQSGGIKLSGELSKLIDVIKKL